MIKILLALVSVFVVLSVSLLAKIVMLPMRIVSNIFKRKVAPA
jgi:hypothetical protein